MPAPRTKNPGLAQALKKIERNDFAGARTVLERALKAQPTDHLVLHQLGLVHSRMGDNESAAKLLKEAIKHGANSPSAYGSLGAILMRLERSDEALELMNRAVETFPDNTHIWTNYANALGQQKDFDGAFRALDKALDADPENPVVYNLISRFHNEAGDNDKAREFARKGLLLKDDLAHKNFAAQSSRKRLSLNERTSRQGKNVISFSLFGRSRTYTFGAVENAKLAGALLPGWECRVYHDETVPKETLDALVEAKAKCIPATGKRKRLAGTFWRFFANDDPAVSRFICRDVDCRLNTREVAAIDEWIASDLDFHLMKDHPWHSDLILAGLWGGKAGVLPKLEPLALRAYSNQADKWDDQVFLGNYVWPLIKDRCLIHDSQFGLFGSKPFPEGSDLTPPDHVGYSVRFKERVQKLSLKVRKGSAKISEAGPRPPD